MSVIFNLHNIPVSSAFCQTPSRPYIQKKLDYAEKQSEKEVCECHKKIDAFLKMKQKFHVRIGERELTHDPNQKLYQ
jgi:hypothetical protein